MTNAAAAAAAAYIVKMLVQGCIRRESRGLTRIREVVEVQKTAGGVVGVDYI